MDTGFVSIPYANPNCNPGIVSAHPPRRSPIPTQPPNPTHLSDLTHGA